MGFFILPEINPGISQPAVCKIELHRRANVPFPLYVITFCPADEKGIFKIVQVRLDRVRVDGYVFYELKRCPQVSWGLSGLLWRTTDSPITLPFPPDFSHHFFPEYL